LTKKILFIIPPNGPFDSFIPKGPGQKKYFLTPPYGVLSIISYINEDKNYDITIFDCNKTILENLNCSDLEKLTYDSLKETILSFNPNYICISALFNTSFSHMKMVKEIKHYYSDAPILIGGGLATNLYEELFNEFPEIDAICFGEGEIPVKELFNANVPVSEYHTVSPAWITKESLSTGNVPQHNMVNDINEIPIIDFSYIDLKKYNGRSYIEKNPLIEKIEVSIHTSRGCPFFCIFCSNAQLHGKKVRLMSLDKVIETIESYKKNYGLTILLVEDDHFLSNKKRALDILKYIKDNNITVEFPNGLAVYKIDDDIAQALSDAKVKLVTLAIESGSDYVLKNLMSKPLNTKQITKAVNILRKYDIRIHVFIVIGIPGEFDSHREESLNFIINLGIDWAYVFIAIPIAGSRLFKICKKNNYLISNSYDNHTISHGSIKAPGVDPKEIEEYAYYMNIMINFIENINIKKGRYEVAEEYFQNVIRSYPEQAIAYYMLSIIYKNTNPIKYEEYYNNYLKYYDKHIGIYKNSRFWKKLIEHTFMR